MVLIDANVMLRFLLERQNEQWTEGRVLIESGQCYTLSEVIAEVVYVLGNHYGIDRIDIRNSILRILEYVSIDQPELILSAMTYYTAYGVDYVDGVLISRALLLGENVFTFDKKVRKLIQRGRNP